MTEGCPSHWSCSITRYHVGVCSSMQYGYQIICVSWVSSEVLSKANILHAIRIKLVNILYLRQVPLVEYFIWDLAGFVLLDLQFSVWCFVDRNYPFSFFFFFFFFFAPSMYGILLSFAFFELLLYYNVPIAIIFHRFATIPLIIWQFYRHCKLSVWRLNNELFDTINCKSLIISSLFSL